MASFKGLNFSFDGHSSEEFNLKIVNIDKSGWNTESIGANYEPVLDENPLKIIKNSYGVHISENLEFEMVVASLERIDRDTVNRISSWLFARRKPCKLYIDQPDMQNKYFECFLTSPKQVSRGNFAYAVSFTVSCTSPFMWSNDIISSISVTNGSGEITLYHNGADYDGYINPVIEIESVGDVSKISIVNQRDGNRETGFDFSGTGIIGFTSGEIIKVDTENRIVSSSNSINRLTPFNKKWLRIKSGSNKLLITGNGKYKFTYRVPYIAGV